MNNITKLNNHLFKQLDRLSQDLTDTQLAQEIDRSHAVTAVAKEIIAAGTLSVAAEKIRQEYRSPSNGKNLLEDIK